MSQNPFQTETPKTLAQAVFRAIIYIITNVYFWVTIGFAIIQSVLGLEFLLSNVYSTPIHVIIALVFSSIGAYGIRLDLKKKFKNKKEKIPMPVVLMMIGFVYMLLLSHAINFEIEIFMDVGELLNPDKMKENPLVFQSHLYGIFLYVPYPFFFYYKEIREWVCKRDKLIEDYEKKMETKS